MASTIAHGNEQNQLKALEALNKNNNVFGDLGEDANLPDDILADDEIKELFHEEKNCELCDKKFNLVTPRHHCRKCYQSVCNTCSSSRRRLCKKSEKEYRVCDFCDT